GDARPLDRRDGAPPGLERFARRRERAPERRDGARAREDGGAHAAPKATTVEFPPNANEFESATATRASRASFGTTSRSHAGSGSPEFVVGGTMPVAIVRTVATASIAPAEQRQWPSMDLMDETGISRARAPSARLMAAVSAESFCGVAVPCAFT